MSRDSHVGLYLMVVLVGVVLVKIICDWLIRLGQRVVPGRVKRDISRLGGPGDSEVGPAEEVVDTSGGPLKEHHRRRALRDKRLLPKPKEHRAWGSKRRKYLTQAEATRLFSPTMLTRNRQIRDLLPDEEQLQRYELPLWKTEADVAQALGISVGQLRFYAIHREKERVQHYVTYRIAKKSGGERVIMAPKRRLKALQRQLNALLISRLPVSDCAHGFRAGRSIRSGAEAHVNKAVVLHLDLKDFFPSLHFGRVRGLLIAYGYGYPVATSLAVLMTEAERQPVVTDEGKFFVPVTSRYCVQGAPTSPGLGNALVLRLDHRLAGLARKFNFNYTRYADDLTFSGDDPTVVHQLRALIGRIVQAEGFAVNPKKTRVMRRSARQLVTGVVVNKDLGLSRQTRRRLRAMGHQLGKAMAAGTADPQRLRQLRGKLAYLAMLNPSQAEKLRPAFLTAPAEPQA